MTTYKVRKVTETDTMTWEISVEALGVRMYSTLNGRKGKKRHIPLAKCFNLDPESEAEKQLKKLISEGWTQAEETTRSQPEKKEPAAVTSTMGFPKVWF